VTTQTQIIQDFFQQMSKEGGQCPTKVDSEKNLLHYRWRLTTDKENSIFELMQSRTFIEIRTVTLRYKDDDRTKLLNLLNGLNAFSHFGTFTLTDLFICLESNHFYYENSYTREEIAYCITGIISRLSLFYLCGDYVFNQNFQIELAINKALKETNGTHS
jgi:hypothetical protein